MLFSKKILPLFVLIFITSFSFNAHPSGRGRELIIEGLRIFNHEELNRILKIRENLASGKTGKETAESISTFYRKNGYSLVKVHIVEDSPGRLALYVNESRCLWVCF